MRPNHLLISLLANLETVLIMLCKNFYVSVQAVQVGCKDFFLTSLRLFIQSRLFLDHCILGVIH